VKEYSFDSGRGGGGSGARYRYRLTRRDRIILLAVIGFNAATALFNFWRWCETGWMVSLVCGEFGASMTLWVIWKNQSEFRGG